MALMEQLYAFALTVGIGFLAGLLYDFYRVLRSLIRFQKVFTFIGDLAFWIILTIAVFTLLVFGNQGEVRLYVLLGLALGALIYSKFFSFFILDSIRYLFYLFFRLMRLLLRIIRFIWSVLAFPFKMAWLAIVLPFRCLQKGIKMICEGASYFAIMKTLKDYLIQMFKGKR